MTNPPPKTATRRRTGVWLGAVGLTLGLLAFAVFGSVFVWGARTSGAVVGEHKDSQGKCSPELEYDAAGQRHRTRPWVRFSSDCDWNVGEKITVYYWPSRPAEPSLLSFASVFVPGWVPLALLLVGLWLVLTKPAARPL